jgi:hypothetical protein
MIEMLKDFRKVIRSDGIIKNINSYVGTDHHNMETKNHLKDLFQVGING